MAKQYNNFVFKLALICAVFYIQPAQALTFKIDSDSDLVGKMKTITTQKGDTLYSVGRAYDIGILEMQEANPKININKAMPAGTNLIIPAQFILPPGERKGIVINLAELRVYYYDPDGKTVTTHPLGIGRQGWRTPIGETTIIRKREHPTWTPPDSIRAAEEDQGIDLPDVIPAGPNNPLGEYAMNLGWNGYLMHGTNAPNSIGNRSSHGCMRMYAEDIKDMYERVEVGTTVRVIYQPFKLGVKDGQLYLEAHALFADDYYNPDNQNEEEILEKTVAESNYPNSSQINWEQARQLIRDDYGYPVNITTTVNARPEQSL